MVEWISITRARYTQSNSHNTTVFSIKNLFTYLSKDYLFTYLPNCLHSIRFYCRLIMW